MLYKEFRINSNKKCNGNLGPLPCFESLSIVHLMCNT